MLRLASVIVTAVALSAFAGCKPPGGADQNGTDDHQHDDDAHGHTHDGDDAHDHDHDHDHDAEAHAQPDEAHAQPDDTHGTPSDLGTSRIGGFEVHATQFGDVIAGGDGSIELHLVTLPEGVDPFDVTMRIWIGTESGAESMKSMAGYDADARNFHTHVTVPSPLPSDSKWWVEIDTAGDVTRGSFDLPE